MMDRREAFVSIEEKLSEIRILCNRLQIPFVWVAAVYDDGKGTDYKIIQNIKRETRVPAEKEPGVCYTANGLTPMSMGERLADDRIRAVINILNGFEAVPRKEDMAYSEGELLVETGRINDKLMDFYGLDGRNAEGAFIEAAGEDLQDFGIRVDEDLPDERPQFFVSSYSELPYIEKHFKED